MAGTPCNSDTEFCWVREHSLWEAPGGMSKQFCESQQKMLLETSDAALASYPQQQQKLMEDTMSVACFGSEDFKSATRIVQGQCQAYRHEHEDCNEGSEQKNNAICSEREGLVCTPSSLHPLPNKCVKQRSLSASPGMSQPDLLSAAAAFLLVFPGDAFPTGGPGPASSALDLTINTKVQHLSGKQGNSDREMCYKTV